MGLRDTLNKNPLIPSIIGIVAVAVAGYVVYGMITDKGLRVEMPNKHYFTVDDGKTLFEAPTTAVAPFDKDGKPAVRAYVFTCDKSKTQFVAYLAKYTDDFAKRATAELAKPAVEGQTSILDSSAAATSLLVRKPGESQWVSATSNEGQRVSSVHCPSNDPWDLVELHPK